MTTRAPCSDPQRLLRRLVPTPVFDMPLLPTCPIQGHWAALVATQDVEGTPVRCRDIVLQLSKRGNPEPPGLRGVRFRVPRSCLSRVADAIETLHVLELARGPTWEHTVPDVLRLLRLPQRAQWKDATSPLLIVRSVGSPVSQPVVAHSDDEALFELLYQVGCRL